MIITLELLSESLIKLNKEINKNKGKVVRSPDLKRLCVSVIDTWFKNIRPYLEAQGIPNSQFEQVDELLSQLLSLTTRLSLVKKYKVLIKEIRKIYNSSVYIPLKTTTKPLLIPRLELEGTSQIKTLLRNISPHLEDGYIQVLNDLEDRDRLSYKGTSNELREVLRGVLIELAPDEEVCKQSWYKQEKESKGPTRKQRVKYILKNRKASKNENEAFSNTHDLFDEIFSRVVVSTYDRANEASHREKQKEDVLRLLSYFNVLIKDLAQK